MSPPDERRTRDTSLAGDVLWTSASNALMLLLAAAASALLARRGVGDVFGPYMLAKRVSAAAMPFLSLGMGLAIAKFLGGSASLQERREYTIGSIGMVSLVALCASIVVALFPGGVGRLLLGTSSGKLVTAAWVYAVSSLAVTMLYSLFRGMLRQRIANLVRIIGIGVVPAGVLLLAPPGWTAPAILLATGVALLLMSGIGILAIAVPAVAGSSAEGVLTGARRMLKYSLPRIPGGLAQGALLTVGPVVSTHSGSPLETSALLAGVTLVQLGAMSGQSISAVLLPRVSRLDTLGRGESIRSLSDRSLLFLVLSGVAMLSFLSLEIGDLMRLWLGPELVPLSSVSLLLTACIPAVLGNGVFTSVTDGALSRPVSAYAAIAGILVSGPIVYAGRASIWVIALGTVLGYWLTFVIVYLSAKRVFSLRVNVVAVLKVVGVLATTWFVCYAALRLAVVADSSAVIRLVLIATIHLAGAAAAARLVERELGVYSILHRLITRRGHG